MFASDGKNLQHSYSFELENLAAKIVIKNLKIHHTHVEKLKEKRCLRFQKILLWHTTWCRKLYSDF